MVAIKEYYLKAALIGTDTDRKPDPWPGISGSCVRTQDINHPTRFTPNGGNEKTTVCVPPHMRFVFPASLPDCEKSILNGTLRTKGR